jgi:hypothetical protein
VHRREIGWILVVPELDNPSCHAQFSAIGIITMPIIARVIRYAVIPHPAIRVGGRTRSSVSIRKGGRAALQLPAIYEWAEGGLPTYGPRLPLIYRQVARSAAEILRSAKPADELKLLSERQDRHRWVTQYSAMLTKWQDLHFRTAS